MKYNRWYALAGAVLIQASLGAIYIYSVFKPALKEHFGDWSAADLALPAQAVLAFFALGMIFAGRIQDRVGPQKTLIAGAAILLAGMFIAAKSATLAQFVFGFGVLGGIGIGAAYVCPIAVCAKWFPDKRGLITGLAVAGFGAGGLIFAPLASYFIAVYGIMAALFYLGLIFFTSILLGALMTRTPPENYCPAGWMRPLAAAAHGIDHSVGQMARTRRFWVLWLTYFIGAAAGLMVIMNLVTLWQSAAAGSGFENILADDYRKILAGGALAVMLVSIFNSLGRIVWGKISDVFGRQKTLSAAFLVCGIALAILPFTFTFAWFAAAVCAVGFCFGGFLALYPAITADLFGTKNIGANYGAMFAAYGAGGLVGPWMFLQTAANVKKIPYEAADAAGKISIKFFEAGDYSIAFAIAAVLCGIGALAIWRLRPQK